MHRTVAVVAALCVLSPAAIAATASPVTEQSSRATPPGSASAASVPTTPIPPVRAGRPNAIASPPAVLATPAENTTAYLAIAPGNVSNATTTAVTLDVGGALAVDTAATEGRIGTLTIDERLSRANTTAAKRAVIREVGTRIERRIERLGAEQRAAIEAYEGGELRTREFVRTLGRIQVRAVRLRGTIDRLETAAVSVPASAINGTSVDSWARDRRVRVGLLTSPLRREIVAALRGIDPVTVYVETADTGADGADGGVVLATIDNGRYVRDAYLPAERDDGPPNEVGSILTALDRVSAAYPWAWNASAGVESAGGPAAGSYRFTLFHRQGRLTTHLDAESANVFREIQVKRLRAVPTAPPVAVAEAGLGVQVGRTHITGPMNVSITAAGGGRAANATVFVDDRIVGRTGPDGSLWAITPRGEVNVTVVNGESTATVRFASDPRSTAEDGTGSTGSAGSANESIPSANGSASAPGDRSEMVETGSDPEADPSTETGLGAENGSDTNVSRLPTKSRSTLTARATPVFELRPEISG